MLSHHQGTPWNFVFARIADTFLGLFFGLFVSYCLWKTDSKIELKKTLSKSLDICKAYFEKVSTMCFEGQSDILKKHQQELEIIC